MAVETWKMLSVYIVGFLSRLFLLVGSIRCSKNSDMIYFEFDVKILELIQLSSMPPRAC